MGFFYAVLVIPLAPAFWGLAVVVNVGFAVAEFLRGADAVVRRKP